MAGLLAGLDAELVGVLFLIVMLAAGLVLRSYTSSAAHGVPVIGGQIGDAVDRFWANLFAALAGPSNAAVGTFTSTIEWLTAQWSQLSATVAGLAQLTYTAGHQIATVALPRATGLVLAQAQTLVTAARAYALLQVQRAEALGAAALAASEAQGLALYQQGQAVALGLFRTAEHDAAMAVAVAERDAIALALQERAFASAGIITAEGYSEHLLTAAIAQMHAIEAGILGQLGGVSVADEQRAEGLIKTLRDEIDAASKALAATATGSIAAVALDVAAIKALRCIQLCNYLAGVGEVMALVDAVALIALAQEAISHPDAVRRAWMADVQPVINEAAAAVRAGIGA